MREKDKKSAYRWIRVSGLMTLIPIALSVGPLAGYAAGEWLHGTFGWPAWTGPACAAAGFLGGVRETIRIIRVALKSAGATPDE